VIRTLALAAVLLATAGCSSHRETPTSETSPPMVSLGAIPELQLRPGASGTIVVPVTVAPGYHVQANPAANELYIPLELEIDPVEDLQIDGITYPKSISLRLEGATEELLTYEGTVRIDVAVRVAASAEPGRHAVQGSLRYQACDSKRCFFPASIPVTFDLVVAN